MRTTIVSLAAAVSMAFVVGTAATPAQAACGNGWGTGEVIGTLGGAALGGFIGSQIGSGTGRAVAIGIGVAGGGILGNRIGHSMDCANQRRAVHDQQRALEQQPVGQTSQWSDPDSGYSGGTTPTNTWYNEQGRPCRDFVTTVYHNGQSERVDGTACRSNSGEWVTVQS